MARSLYTNNTNFREQTDLPDLERVSRGNYYARPSPRITRASAISDKTRISRVVIMQSINESMRVFLVKIALPLSRSQRARARGNISRVPPKARKTEETRETNTRCAQRDVGVTQKV